MGQQQRREGQRGGGLIVLFPTNGSRFYVSASHAEPGSVPPRAWSEIGEVESVGAVGGQWPVEQVDYLDAEYSAYLKSGNLGLGQVQFILGCDPDDEGQSMLWQAYRDKFEDFAFRAVFPDGQTSREWRAIVFGISEVWDAVNRVIMLQADTQLTVPVWRSSEG